MADQVQEQIHVCAAEAHRYTLAYENLFVLCYQRYGQVHRYLAVDDHVNDLARGAPRASEGGDPDIGVENDA